MKLFELVGGSQHTLPFQMLLGVFLLLSLGVVSAETCKGRVDMMYAWSSDGTSVALVENAFTDCNPSVCLFDYCTKTNQRRFTISSAVFGSDNTLSDVSTWITNQVLCLATHKHKQQQQPTTTTTTPQGRNGARRTLHEARKLHDCDSRYRSILYS
jgi:hypothetical protein